LALWEGRTNLSGIASHPLLTFLQQVAQVASTGEDGQINFDFKVPMLEVFEYAVQIACWLRLTKLEASDADDFSCVDYWTDHIMGVDCIREAWRAETILGFDTGGQAKLEFFSTRLDADKESDSYKQAEQLVWLILTEASMQKISRGRDLTYTLQLGILLDLPENAGKDHGAGTFAELLRYGTVHFRQKRDKIATIPTLVPYHGTTKKGHLEPF
jgi:hypothetical protein